MLIYNSQFIIHNYDYFQVTIQNHFEQNSH